MLIKQPTPRVVEFNGTGFDGYSWVETATSVKSYIWLRRNVVNGTEGARVDCGVEDTMGADRSVHNDVCHV